MYRKMNDEEKKERLKMCRGHQGMVYPKITVLIHSNPMSYYFKTKGLKQKKNAFVFELKLINNVI